MRCDRTWSVGIGQLARSHTPAFSAHWSAPTALAAAITAFFALSVTSAIAEAPTPGPQAYTKSHADNPSPPDLLGGPLTVTARQSAGATYFILPGPRRLDPSVFNTPYEPLGFDPAPKGLLGVPTKARNASDGAYTITKQATPFSDWAESSNDGSFHMTLVDATAVDGATTKDRVDFEASFTAPDGQRYRVTARKAIPHGGAYPFFGGVVTNHLLHGVTGVGTRLMPTEYTYAAFWAVGDVYKGDVRIADHQLIHAMVTEFVRGENYKLAFDSEVGDLTSGGGKTVHLMVAPYRITPNGLQPAPLKTGFMPFQYIQKHMQKAMLRAQQLPADQRAAQLAILQQTKEVMQQTKKDIQQGTKAGKMSGQPFFHVMFNDFTIEGVRGQR